MSAQLGITLISKVVKKVVKLKKCPGFAGGLGVVPKKRISIFFFNSKNATKVRRKIIFGLKDHVVSLLFVAREGKILLVYVD